MPLLSLICAAAVWATPALAQINLYWTGQSDGNWSNSGNWTTNPASSGPSFVLPQNGDDLYFGFNSFGDSNHNMTNNTAGLSLDALHFGNNSYELSGNQLTVSLIDNTDENGVNNGLGVNSETVDFFCPLVVVGSMEVDSGNAPGNQTQTTLYTHLYGPITFVGQEGTLYLVAESSGNKAGGNGNIYETGIVSGDGDVYALAQDDTVGDVSSVQFNGTNGNTFSGTLYIGTTGNAQIVFDVIPYLFEFPGFVATNAVRAYPYLFGNVENISFAAPDQLGDYTVLGVSNGLTLHLSGQNVTVGSVELENDPGDTNASTLDIDNIELGLNYNIISSNANASVIPLIKGYINLNALVNCNITGTSYAGLELPATLASQGGLSLNGNNALMLEGSNLFTGQVIINPGSTLDVRSSSALGTPRFAPSSGVQLNGGTLTLDSVSTPELTPLTVTASNSALIANGTSSWDAENGNDLEYQLSVFAFGSLQLNGNVTGPGGLTLFGNDVTLSAGANAYSGTTFSLCTLLTLGDDSGAGGPLVIGSSNGPPCEVRWQGSFQMFSPKAAAQSPVTIYPTGLMNLNGFQDIIGSLTFHGGTVELGADGELMPGPVLVDADSGQVSIEGGALDTGPYLGSVTFPASTVSAIDVESYLVNVLTINSTIVGDQGITKEGPGYLPLTGNNTFTGNNLVSNGIVEVYSSTGLGSSFNVTTVEPDGTLIFNTNVEIESVFTNSGSTLLENSTTLNLSGGLTNSGLIAVTAGTTLIAGSGFSTTVTSGSSPDSTITGAGNLLVEGPADFAGTVNVSGSNIFNLTGFYVANMTGDYTCTNNSLTISGGTANFDGTGVIAPATLTVNLDGTLGGSNLVTVSGPTALNASSTLSGTNLVVANGGLAIPGLLDITGRTLVNNGDCEWDGVGAIGLNNGAILSNGLAGIFDSTADGIIQNGGSGLVANVGLFRKTGGTASTTINPLFNNSGNMQVQTATLDLSGGLINSGAVTVFSGGTLDAGGVGVNSLSTPSSSITGAGNIVFFGTGNYAGTVNVAGANTFNSGTATLTGPYTCTNNALTVNGTAILNGTGVVAPATLTINLFGNLGGSDLVSVSGPTLLGVSSTLSGANQVIANGGLTIMPGFNISGRTLINAATGLWTNSQGGVAGLGMSGGAVLSNAPGANLEFNGNGTVGFSTGGGVIANAGTLLKTGAGTTSTLDVPFTNSGLVNIEAGTLAISGGGASPANISVPSGSAIQFGGGTFTLPPGGSITGAGTFTVSAGTPNFAGTVNLGGANTISGGTATFTGSYTCINNALTIGGTANFNGTGTIAPSTLTVNTFGNLSGSNIVTVSGATVLGASSALSGANLVVANGGLTILPGFNISGRTLVNMAAALWTNTQGGVAGLNMSGGAMLSNAPGGSFDMDGNGNVGFSTGSGTIVNAGTLLKTGASSTSTVGVPFSNNGTVSLQSGILAANGGYVSASNAVLNSVLGGTTAGATYGQLQVGGAVTLTGTLSVNFAGTYSPKTNDSFTLVTAGTRSGTFLKFIYPSNQVSMVLSNTATAVIATVTGVIVPQQPILHLEKLSGKSGLLYWSTNFSNYFLEYNTSLGTTNWAASALTPVVVGTNMVVTNTLSSTQKFYRLSSAPATYTPPPPALSIGIASPGVVQLLWPIDDDRPFFLQTTTNLFTPDWTTLTNSPATSGTTNVVTNSVTGASRFFRLSNH